MQCLEAWNLSQVAVLKNEPRSEFESRCVSFRRELKPIRVLEEVLVEKLAVTVWRYRRLLELETTTPKSTIELMVENDERGVHPLGQLQWELALRYESNLERAFDPTLSQLERLQRTRLGQPVPPRIELDLNR